MDGVMLDWSSAEADDGKLVVAVSGEAPEGWAHAFERTATLLNSGGWKNVKFKKGTVRISGVAPGDEERVRHFLESIVQEANSVVASPQPSASADGDGDGDSEKTSEDAQMVERFRSFAHEDPHE